MTLSEPPNSIALAATSVPIGLSCATGRQAGSHTLMTLSEPPNSIALAATSVPIGLSCACLLYTSDAADE